MEAKKTYKSFQYRTSALWEGRLRGLLSSPGKPVMEVSSPPEFKGDPQIWTPEDLFVASVNTCLMTTFLAYARSKGLDLASYESDGVGTLENVDGKFQFTSIALHPHLVVRSPEDVEKAREILAAAKANCLVSNSIRTAVAVYPQIQLPDAREILLHTCP